MNKKPKIASTTYDNNGPILFYFIFAAFHIKPVQISRQKKEREAEADRERDAKLMYANEGQVHSDNRRLGEKKQLFSNYFGPYVKNTEPFELNHNTTLNKKKNVHIRDIEFQEEP